MMRGSLCALVLLLSTACGTRAPSANGTSATTSSSGSGGASTTATTTTTGSGGNTGGTGGTINGLGAPDFAPGDLDAASHGGTITFQQIGAAGWYPSRRDPASGMCDAINTDTCCMTKHAISGVDLTPWDEDLIMTLRGPLVVKQFAAYQPSGDSGWKLASAWDERSPGSAHGLAFDGNDTETSGFPGSVGSECLVNLSTADLFTCGPGSVPYCPSPSGAHHAYKGWSGSKLFVLLAAMPHADSTNVQSQCSKDNTGNWYDAPWIALSHGELVRAGSFSSCQCYAKDPNQWYLGDGCGQFNVFEVVNDNNSSKNLDVFSTNFFGYAGYVGEGPCGPTCDASKLSEPVDLIAKSTDTEAKSGALASPTKGPGAAFRRPESGYRYFIILMDVPSRTVALAMVHPQAVPAALGPLLPNLPTELSTSTVDAVRALRLPN